ncbi:MAG: hypothetical protein AB1641_21385 [Thermodesulfobacteriota bacterium]
MSTHRQAISWQDWAGEPVSYTEAGWTLARKYRDEDTDAPAGLIDLSHRPKALVYGPAVEKLGRLSPGRAEWNGQAFLCCRKPGECIVYDLLGPLQPQWPDRYYTDMTDAWVLLALIGPRAREVIQRLAAIDFERPDRPGPLFAVTRGHGLWLQLLNPRRKAPGFFLATERSHGQNLAKGLRHVGHHLGLKIMGLDAFNDWFTRSD